MIRKHTRRAAKAAFAVSLGVAIVIGLFAGSARSATTAGPTIVIGTKNFDEEYILGQLYKQALEAKGFDVSYKENIGSTELVQTALTSGKINFYPEYTGVIVQVVFHKATSPKTAAKTYTLAKSLEKAKGYSVLSPTPFYDTDVLAVTNATAKKYGLKSIGDLKKVGAFKLGGFPECQTRNTCFVGYTKQYGLSGATFVPLAGISAYAALDSGKVLAADVFSTDPPLGKGSKYTVLADPKHVTGFQNVAPIVKASVAQAAGLRLHEDSQLGLGQADPARDPGDEQGRDRRQAGPGGRRQVVPAGERAHLTFPRRAPGARRRRPPAGPGSHSCSARAGRSWSTPSTSRSSPASNACAGSEVAARYGAASTRCGNRSGGSVSRVRRAVSARSPRSSAESSRPPDVSSTTSASRKRATCW